MRPRFLSVKIRKKAYGRAHESVGQSHYNLGVLYRLQNRFAEAEPHYRRSMAIQEKALGPMHPSLGDTLSNYAVLLMMTGRGANAAPRRRDQGEGEVGLSAARVDGSTTRNDKAARRRPPAQCPLSGKSGLG